MSKYTVNNFLDFIRKNPPPAVPGSSVYNMDWDGKIKETPKFVTSICLQENWEWEIKNKNPAISLNNYIFSYFFSLEEALRSRNSLKVSYVILQKSKKGNIGIEFNSELESYCDYWDNLYSVDTSSKDFLDVSNLPATEDFITSIIQKCKATIQAESIIAIEINNLRSPIAFFVLDDYTYTPINLNFLTNSAYKQFYKIFS